MAEFEEAVLTRLLEAVIVREEVLENNAKPVTSSPAANVILCTPAANTALAVVHTIVNAAAVIVQVAVSAAEPDAGTSTPAGLALAL